MDLTLQARLLRFLDREEEDERRSFRDLWALPVAERVLEGECIEDAVLETCNGDTATFRVAENASKFRDGDAVIVDDGVDLASGCRMVYGSYDASTQHLVLERDAFARKEDQKLAAGQRYCIDRRPLGLRGRLKDVVRAGFAETLVRQALHGERQPTRDAARRERAISTLARRGLDASQLVAAAEAIAGDLTLIQGPPGTGKTRLLAEMLAALCTAGCRIVLSAFTHRAVDNALLALRRAAPDVAAFKLGGLAALGPELREQGVRSLHPRRGSTPAGGLVVGGTCFALAKLAAREQFHFAVFDEAGQIPIPHAMAGMLLARRWIMLGDHQQLPPVITAEHADRLATISVFEHLHAIYGSRLLDVTYRMNDQLCGVVSSVFYGGALRPDAVTAARRMPFTGGGRFDEVLHPERSVVLARLDHLQPGMRSPEEANLAADLVEEVLRRHGVPPHEIAVIAPFRAQVRAIRSALQRKHLRGSDAIVVDTVERVQGQEREVVLLSLAAGDPDSLSSRAGFFFSTNRLNVALSRARTKAIVIASRGAFAALPMDAASLRGAAVFKRIFHMLPQVDLSAVYC